MTRHIGWAADEFLLEQGFTIIDPGPGCSRIATRRGMSFDLEPRCCCEFCPSSRHRRYRYVSTAVTS